MNTLSDDSQDLLFRKARTRNGWQAKPVSEDLLRQVYELAKWPPTAANSNPARYVFLTSDAAKQRIEPFLSANNKAKSMAAPVITIVAYDMEFPKKIPELMPHNPGAQHWFANNAEETAMRNGTLQGAYLMLAARSLGLDCGPMSGFDKAGVDAEFFAGTSWQSNFLVNLGYGSDENLFERLPRLAFEDACRVL